ncbi:carbohydrate porin [Tenacibaculum sp. UWU-22]|uniref:carbohydrate porin n=1 Tax=Tenacibaculum sp. UWU-22 TaxID=3234187 RepID=UPI0034DADFBA
MKSKILLLLLACFVVANLKTYAQSKSDRKYLTGNWGGVRNNLESKGLYINSRLTVLNQNFVAGTGDKESVFNGKAQLDVKFNGKSIGLSSWTLVSKAEYNFGNDVGFAGDVLLPKNTSIAFPGNKPGERFDISSLYFVYDFNKSSQLLFGKINVVDLGASAKYSGGAGLDAFWNMGFAAPISGIMPAYLFGAIANITGKKLNWTMMVYDPVSTVHKTGLEAPFAEGVVLLVAPSWPVKIGNSLGSHSLQLTFSTQDGDNLYNLGDINSDIHIPLSDKKYRYFASYSFDQPIRVFNDKSSWGVFGQIAVSDGNPNPVDFSFLLGIGGNSFIKNRTQDKWGLALYNYSLSKIIDDKAEALGTPLRNELGLETFYQYWATQWFSIGADVQVINPIIKNNDTAVFLGLRSSFKL